MEWEFFYLFLSTLIFMIIFLSLTIIFELFPYENVSKNYENVLNFSKFFYDLMKVLFLFSSLYLGFLVQLFMKIEKIENQGIILFIKTVIYGPFMEEIIYRFIIFELLINGNKGFSPICSSLITSCLFGISKII